MRIQIVKIPTRNLYFYPWRSTPSCALTMKQFRNPEEPPVSFTDKIGKIVFFLLPNSTQFTLECAYLIFVTDARTMSV